MEKLYVQRRALVDRLLKERPICEYEPTHKSEVVHEIQMRSHGGDILNPDNCRALCRHHHRYVHDHPEESYQQGWLQRRFE